jgi:hypothetical protein
MKKNGLKWFEIWFRKKLPSLYPNCIAVMDNASYKSVRAEKFPLNL